MLRECEHQEGTWWAPAKVTRSIPPSVWVLPGEQKNKPSLGFRFLKRPEMFLFTVLRGCIALLFKVIYFTDFRPQKASRVGREGSIGHVYRALILSCKGLNECSLQHGWLLSKVQGWEIALNAFRQTSLLIYPPGHSFELPLSLDACTAHQLPQRSSWLPARGQQGL